MVISWGLPRHEWSHGGAKWTVTSSGTYLSSAGDSFGSEQPSDDLVSPTRRAASIRHSRTGPENALGVAGIDHPRIGQRSCRATRRTPGPSLVRTVRSVESEERTVHLPDDDVLRHGLTAVVRGDVVGGEQPAIVQLGVSVRRTARSGAGSRRPRSRRLLGAPTPGSTSAPGLRSARPG